MNWKRWTKAASVRAIKTAGQSFGAAVVATGVASAWEINWPVIAGIVVLSTLLSLATSIAGLPEIAEEKEEAK